MNGAALIVIDVQNGFMTPECRRIIPNVLSLIEAAKKKGIPVIFTKFMNRERSGYVKWIGWRRMMEPPETDLAPELTEYDSAAHNKMQYSSFTTEVEGLLKEQGVSRLFLCGIATDGCILKTAVDAFERGIEPIVAIDACYSHGGESVHQAGLLLLRRFIGSRQLKTCQETIELM